MGVPQKAVAVVQAARAWAPVFELRKAVREGKDKAKLDEAARRGSAEDLQNELVKRTEALFTAVRELELELKKNPIKKAKKPRTPTDWAGMFGFVATVATAAQKVMKTPPAVVVTDGEDVTGT